MPYTAHTIGLLISNATERKQLAEFLAALKYRVVTTPLAEEPPPSWQDVGLAIADEHAAQYYGQQLLGLKWRLGTAFMPILIALHPDVDSVPWLRLGFDDVLRLPVEKAELAARLSVFLRLREQSEQRYRAVVENALIGIFRMTPEGRLLMANPALLAMLGYEDADDLARDVAEEQAGGAYLHRAFRHCLDAGGRVIGHEASWTRPESRQTIYFRENMTALYDEAGRVIGYEGTVEDISERVSYEQALRKARDAAEAASRAKSTFLANMSHEIRTPLTGIIGFTSFLSKQVSEEQRRYVDLIERSGQRLMSTLESVLTLAKLEANRIEIQAEPIDVVPEVEEVVARFKSQAEQRRLPLSLTVAPGAAEARAVLDRAAFHNILQHLLGNALKFTEEGRIDVLVEQDETHVRIHVEDTGVGIDPNFMPHLFEAFQQESSGIIRSHGGNGLGLYIARQLTAEMEGTISATSEKGAGSRFTLSFPLVDASSEAEASPAAVRSLSSNGQARLLFVEDHPETQFLLESLLEDTYDVTLATTAEEALLAAQSTAFDLVFVDIKLGDGPDGFYLLRRLRLLSGYQTTPVVALTAYALPGDRERLLSSGFDTYLRKPFTADELLDTIARFGL